MCGAKDSGNPRSKCLQATTHTRAKTHTNEKQRCVEQKIVVILGLSVFKQQHTQEVKQ